jgi:plasmid maintenance system antidote protein VapI
VGACFRESVRHSCPGDQILREQRGASADNALRLGRYLGTSPEFWMDLQSDYELRRARREAGHAIEYAVCPRPDPA